MTSVNSVNIYQLNIYKIILLMHKITDNNNMHVFKQSFSEVNNKYNTKSSNFNFYKHTVYKTKTEAANGDVLLKSNHVPRASTFTPAGRFQKGIKKARVFYGKAIICQLKKQYVRTSNFSEKENYICYNTCFYQELHNNCFIMPGSNIFVVFFGFFSLDHLILPGETT